MLYTFFTLNAYIVVVDDSQVFRRRVHISRKVEHAISLLSRNTTAAEDVVELLHAQLLTTKLINGQSLTSHKNNSVIKTIMNFALPPYLSTIILYSKMPAISLAVCLWARIQPSTTQNQNNEFPPTSVGHPLP